MEPRNSTAFMNDDHLSSPPRTTDEIPQHEHLSVRKRSNKKASFDIAKLKSCILRACKGLTSVISPNKIVQEAIKNIFDGISTQDIEKALILAATPFIEKDPAYNIVSARLVLQKMYKEIMGTSTTDEALEQNYRETFIKNITIAVEKKLLDERMLTFDLPTLAQSLHIERDHLFGYMGIQTLYERYFLKYNGTRLELPQAFWMRVSMGLCLDEENPSARAIEFYNLLSQLRYVSSTPTLFQSGTTHPQLSSCYLSTISDDLTNIFKCLGDNAQLSKWSGGIGNDWTNLRATNSMIKSINVNSQGVVPFLRIANDVTCAISRSGSRRGATVAYLEAWHYDIEDFLDLRKNTGDERRRTHDMNTANWIPDLFMKRVMADENWSLFTPDEVPELHHIYGSEFEKKYIAYEQAGKEGKLTIYKELKARDLWKKMLSRLFETGHPWITFKDPCNVRSPQDHAGVVHCSNLCTEITLNTSSEETAVCNLGSINLGRHVINGAIDWDMLAQTIKTATRMLDNVIDLNFYPTKEAKHSNLLHRPVGLGVMGFQDALFKLEIPFGDQRSRDIADQTMEFISYHAIMGSSQLAKERGNYPSYKGSKWDRGLFPIDTIDMLEQERGMKIEVSRESKLDWSPVRAHVAKFGMRNSNMMAIAPTATISNISGCFPCIEPMYKNLYVKANMNGEFTVINEYLVEDLKKHNLWNEDMLEQIKYFDGSIQNIPTIPQTLKDKYKESFEIDPEWLIELTAVRAKWIDQSQSHNVFMRGVSGKKLNDIYMKAWKSGLKTTYYLRTLGASQIEKSTLDAKKYGYTQKRQYTETTPAVAAPSSATTSIDPSLAGIKACSITDPDCESCQ